IARRTGALAFLPPDQGSHAVEAEPTIFLGPVHPGPAAVIKPTLPGLVEGRARLHLRRAGLGGNILGQPGARGLAERDVLRCIVEIHFASFRSSAAVDRAARQAAPCVRRTTAPASAPAS